MLPSILIISRRDIIKIDGRMDMDIYSFYNNELTRNV